MLSFDHGLIRLALHGCRKPVKPTNDDWLRMFVALLCHVTPARCVTRLLRACVCANVSAQNERMRRSCLGGSGVVFGLCLTLGSCTQGKPKHYFSQAVITAFNLPSNTVEPQNVKGSHQQHHRSVDHSRPGLTSWSSGQYRKMSPPVAA